MPSSRPHLPATLLQAPSRGCWLKMAFPSPPSPAGISSIPNKWSLHGGRGRFPRALIYLEQADLARGCSEPRRATPAERTAGGGTASRRGDRREPPTQAGAEEQLEKGELRGPAVPHRHLPPAPCPAFGDGPGAGAFILSRPLSGGGRNFRGKPAHIVGGIWRGPHWSGAPFSHLGLSQRGACDPRGGR